MKFKEKLSYGFGDLGNGMMFDMGQIYLLLFYTDILGIPSWVGGLVFLVSKFFDAFVDTAVGTTKLILLNVVNLNHLFYTAVYH